jgi:hypothetical protein
VVKGEHTMYLIVEADERQLQKFLAPFESAGSVEVHPASTRVRLTADNVTRHSIHRY